MDIKPGGHKPRWTKALADRNPGPKSADKSPGRQKPRARNVYSWPLCLKLKLAAEQKKLSPFLSAQAPAHPHDVYVMASEQILSKACNNVFDVVNGGCGVEFEIHINMGRSMHNSYCHFLVLTTVDTFIIFYIVYLFRLLSIIINVKMEIIKNAKGGEKLCFRGFMYTKKSWDSRIRWECSQRKAKNCKGALTTSLQVGVSVTKVVLDQN